MAELGKLERAFGAKGALADVEEPSQLKLQLQQAAVSCWEGSGASGEAFPDGFDVGCDGEVVVSAVGEVVGDEVSLTALSKDLPIGRFEGLPNRAIGR